MRLGIHGVGVVADFGGCKELVNAALGWPIPSHTGIPRTDTTALDILFPTRQLRRMDHFTRMCLLASHQALEQALPFSEYPLGIVLCSGYGPAKTTFAYLDSLISCGEACASPQAFSLSVHNIPAATIALMLGIQCPVTCICQIHNLICMGLITANTWLTEGRARQILFLAVDESTRILHEITERLVDKKMSLKRNVAIGEGAVALLLTLEEKTRYGTVRFKQTQKINAEPIDLRSTYGEIPIGAAFDLAAGALLVAEGHRPRYCGRPNPQNFAQLVIE